MPKWITMKHGPTSLNHVSVALIVGLILFYLVTFLFDPQLYWYKMMENIRLLTYHTSIQVLRKKQRQLNSSKHIYRWSEVSTSELSKFLAVDAPCGHKLEDDDGDGFIFMVLWSPCLFVKLRPRERESWRVGLCGVNNFGCWESCDVGLCIDDEDEVISDDKSLRSCFPSLLSFTFSNCLNLSWRRAMEELTEVIGSLPCLPIWQWVKFE